MTISWSRAMKFAPMPAFHDYADRPALPTARPRKSNQRSFVSAGSGRAAASARPERGGSDRPGNAFSLRWLSRDVSKSRPEAANLRRRDDRSASVKSSRGPSCSVRDARTSASGPAGGSRSATCVGRLCRIGRRALVSSSGARPLHRRGRARVGAARSRCRGAAALLPEAKHQPRPCDPVLAHLRAMTRGKRRRAHIAPRAEHGSNSHGLPRRADAISKAGVRRPDTGRVVRHAGPSGVWLLVTRGAIV